MARIKELQMEILELYVDQMLSAEEIAPIVFAPQDYVEQVIAVYEAEINHYSEVVDSYF